MSISTWSGPGGYGYPRRGTVSSAAVLDGKSQTSLEKWEEYSRSFALSQHRHLNSTYFGSGRQCFVCSIVIMIGGCMMVIIGMAIVILRQTALLNTLYGNWQMVGPSIIGVGMLVNAFALWMFYRARVLSNRDRRYIRFRAYGHNLIEPYDATLEYTNDPRYSTKALKSGTATEDAILPSAQSRMTLQKSMLSLRSVGLNGGRTPGYMPAGGRFAGRPVAASVTSGRSVYRTPAQSFSNALSVPSPTVSDEPLMMSQKSTPSVQSPPTSPVPSFGFPQQQQQQQPRPQLQPPPPPRPAKPVTLDPAASQPAVPPPYPSAPKPVLNLQSPGSQHSDDSTEI